MEEEDSLSLVRLQESLLLLLKQLGDFCRGLANTSEEEEADLENILENILSELIRVKRSFHYHIQNLNPVTSVERTSQSSQVQLMLLEGRVARIREQLQSLITEQEKELWS